MSARRTEQTHPTGAGTAALRILCVHVRARVWHPWHRPPCIRSSLPPGPPSLAAVGPTSPGHRPLRTSTFGFRTVCCSSRLLTHGLYTVTGAAALLVSSEATAGLGWRGEGLEGSQTELQGSLYFSCSFYDIHSVKEHPVSPRGLIAWTDSKCPADNRRTKRRLVTGAAANLRAGTALAVTHATPPTLVNRTRADTLAPGLSLLILERPQSAPPDHIPGSTANRQSASASQGDGEITQRHLDVKIT